MNQTPTWKQVLARNQAFAQQQEQRSIENQLMKLQQEQSANKAKDKGLLGNLAQGVVDTGKSVWNALSTTGAAGVENLRQLTGFNEARLDSLQKESKQARDKWAKSIGFNDYQDAMRASQTEPNRISDAQWASLQDINKRASTRSEEEVKGYEDDWFRKKLAGADQREFGADAAQTLLTAASLMTGGAVGTASTIPRAIGIGALQSGLIGAASGAAEAYRRDEDMLDAAVKSGLQSAAIGGVLGGVSKGLSNWQTNRAAKAAAGRVIDDDKIRIRDKLMGQQSKASMTDQRRVGVTAAENIRDLNRMTGTANQQTQAKLSGMVTGGEGAASTSLNSAFSESEKVLRQQPMYKFQLKSDIQNAIYDNASDEVGQRLLKTIGNDIDSTKPLSKIMRNYERDAWKTLHKVNASDMAIQQADAKLAVARVIEDNLYNNMSSEMVDRAFEGTYSKLLNKADSLRAAGQKNMASHVDDIVNALDNTQRTGKGLRSFQKPFTQSMLLDKSSKFNVAGGNLSGSLSKQGLLGQLHSLTTQPMVERVAAASAGALDRLQTGPVGTALWSGLNAAGKPAGIVGKALSGVPAIAGQATAMAQAGAGDRSATDSRIQEQIGSLGTLQGGGAINAGMLGAPTMQQEPSFGGYKMSDYETAAMSALQAGDTKAYQHYASIYDMLAKQMEKSAGTQTKLTDTQRRAYAAEQSLQELSNINIGLGEKAAQAPVIGSILSGLQGTNIYDSRARALAIQLGYMQSGANIPEAEAERIGRAYVPSAWDSEAARQDKLRRAYALTKQYQQTYAPVETI